ncbi:signal recognition particle-docking protein FtsY [Treponema sp. OMZ 840]|uniref:signal recognition particle-docking protein FtsY n=1 Tax=Treponema sp. OMZ 840 TaxID=244313 RepID=UPI003D906016
MAPQFITKIKQLFSKNDINDDFFDDLADMLVEGDIGAKTAFGLTEELEQRCKTSKIRDLSAIRNQLVELLAESAKSVVLEPDPALINIYMILGVNGTGKTTSVAKMADFYQKKGFSNLIMAASDTFRAAAIEQLCFHGEQLGIRVVSHKHGGDPAAVVFDAAEALGAKGGGLVLADTAGRLHNKENLIHELQKIDRIASAKASAGAYKKILVLDSTTGQNALRQAEVFHDAIGIDAVFLTKHDSSAKGGSAFSLGRELGIPIAFIGSGETYADIKLFDSKRYAYDFLGD